MWVQHQQRVVRQAVVKEEDGERLNEGKMTRQDDPQQTVQHRLNQRCDRIQTTGSLAGEAGCS